MTVDDSAGTADMPDAYRRLKAVFERDAAITDALGALHWDSETTMPTGSASRRAHTVATLKVLAHDGLTAPEVAEDLATAEEEGDRLGSWDRANLSEMRRRHSHASALPADLVESVSRSVSAAEMAWRDARRDKDFNALKPHLQDVLEGQRQMGQALGDALGLSTYDALLDQYDPGMRSATIEPIFEDLARHLPKLLSEVLERQPSSGKASTPAGPFPRDVQKRLAEDLMARLGFDFGRGRLDVSLHPFCGGSTDDVRITTRYEEDDYATALMGVLHETGHALYEQGRPSGWLGQPVGEARGMTLHESQALFVEMQVSRSRAFMAFAQPFLRETFGGRNEDWDVDALYRRAIHVEPGFIRVDADEVTYPLHVIMRYRLERAMLSGDLSLHDLPGAWNDAMRDMLGLVPPDDALGCMQDIHWSAGIWGYFPTYTLGALAAAQLAQAADKALGGESDDGLQALVAAGRFQPIVDWLGKVVHSQGSVASTDGIISAATGRPLDATAFKTHIQRRYLSAD